MKPEVFKRFLRPDVRLKPETGSWALSRLMHGVEVVVGIVFENLNKFEVTLSGLPPVFGLNINPEVTTSDP
jgi:hypothetical protein